MPSLTLNGLPETARFAARLAARLTPRDCIALHGEMGAGKTALARALIRACTGPETEVPSPTYTLAQHYDIHLPGGAARLTHFDLYRLRHASELEEIGFAEALQEGVTLIEWPEIAESLLPESALHLMLSAGEEENMRIVRWEGEAI